MTRYAYIVLLLFIYSCGSYNNTANDNINTSFFDEKNDSKIVYLFFDIEKDANNFENIKLSDKKIVDGFLKNETIYNRNIDEQFLKITLQDSQNNTLKEFILENPLTPTFEKYTKEKISLEKANLNSAEFSIRYNYDPKIQKLIIEKINNNTKIKLFTQNL